MASTSAARLRFTSATSSRSGSKGSSEFVIAATHSEYSVWSGRVGSARASRRHSQEPLDGHHVTLENIDNVTDRSVTIYAHRGGSARDPATHRSAADCPGATGDPSIGEAPVK